MKRAYLDELYKKLHGFDEVLKAINELLPHVSESDREKHRQRIVTMKFERKMVQDFIDLYIEAHAV